MTQDPTPIAYTALTPGTPVQAAEGEQFGTVEAVLAVEDVDVFDGIVVRTETGVRFVDADYVGTITTAYVRTALTAEEARDLPEPDASPSFRADAAADTGSSLADRLGRMFGRGRWKQQ